MLQLMECGNAHQQLPLTLKDPTVWSEGAKEFLDQIISSSPKELLSVSLLPHFLHITYKFSTHFLDIPPRKKSLCGWWIALC